MTAKQRVMASRLIQRIDCQRDYAKRIGISYTLTKAEQPQIIEAQTKKEKVLL